MNHRDLIYAAQKEITEILSQLEKSTGMVVEQISVSNIDVTTISNDRPQWLRRVAIEMKPLPGSSWTI